MNAQAIVEEVNNAIGAHGLWKMRLRTAINSGRCDITAQVAGCSMARRWMPMYVPVCPTK